MMVLIGLGDTDAMHFSLKEKVMLALAVGSISLNSLTM